MKRKIRNINVNGIHYKYLAKDWYIKIYPKDNSDHFVIVDFYTDDLEYQNVLIPIGCFKVFENSEPKYLIVNQPGLVANAIKHFKINEFDFSIQKQYTIIEAVKAFEAMGYEIGKTKIISADNNNFIFQNILKGYAIYLKSSSYIWKLSRHIRPKEEHYQFVGKARIIADNLKNGITASLIINNLNEGNIFDFPYKPEEKDTLIISYKDENPNTYLPLIFLDDTWRKGLFPSLEEYIAEGTITIIEKETL